MTREQAEDLLHDLIFAYDETTNHPKKPSYHDHYVAQREKMIEALVAPDQIANGVWTAIVQTAGGMVEGRPTSRINILQRIRELVTIEMAHEGDKALRSALFALLRDPRGGPEPSREVTADGTCAPPVETSCGRTVGSIPATGAKLKPLFSTAWEREDYEREQRGEKPHGPPFP